jgi:hypothetical protein
MTEQEFQSRLEQPQANDAVYKGLLLDVQVSENCHEYYWQEQTNDSPEVKMLRLEGDQEDFIPFPMGRSHSIAYTFFVSGRGVTWTQ